MKKVTPKTDKYMESGLIVGGGKKKETKKYYPEFTMRHEYFPESKDLKVGSTVKVTVEAKVVGVSISKYQNNTELEIHGYEIEGGKKKE